MVAIVQKSWCCIQNLPMHTKSFTSFSLFREMRVRLLVEMKCEKSDSYVSDEAKEIGIIVTLIAHVHKLVIIFIKKIDAVYIFWYLVDKNSLYIYTICEYDANNDADY